MIERDGFFNWTQGITGYPCWGYGDCSYWLTPSGGYGGGAPGTG